MLIGRRPRNRIRRTTIMETIVKTLNVVILGVHRHKIKETSTHNPTHQIRNVSDFRTMTNAQYTGQYTSGASVTKISMVTTLGPVVLSQLVLPTSLPPLPIMTKLQQHHRQHKFSSIKGTQTHRISPPIHQRNRKLIQIPPGTITAHTKITPNTHKGKTITLVTRRKEQLII